MKKFINQQDMKRSNTADIFNLIRDNGSLTRRQIAAFTDLSWGAVSNITARLIEYSYITECKTKSLPGAGRTPSALTVNSDEHFAIGIDVNETGLSAVVVNLKNEIISSCKRDVSFLDRDTLINEIFDFVTQIITSAFPHHILCIGIAMQGKVDSENGISLALPICKNWVDVPLAYLITKKFALKAYIEHDPNCILYADAMHNKRNDSILLRLDKGIGMSVMLNGKILDTPGIFEIGHTIVRKDGKQCGCGKHGCLTQYTSQKSMAKSANTSFLELVALAENNDENAKSIFYEMADSLALVLTNTANLFNIYDITLCGDTVLHRNLFLDTLTDRLKFYSPTRTPNIYFTDVSYASVGAALTAIERSLIDIDVINDTERT